MNYYREKKSNYVNYGNEILINYGDFHTHTIYSLHGMSSPSEMVDAAIEAGLKYIALTDHFYPYIEHGSDTCLIGDKVNSKNEQARAYEINRSFVDLCDAGIIKVIPGYEYNLFLKEGCPSFVEDSIPHLRNIGYHTWYCDLKYLRISEYLGELDERLGSRKYKVLVHPERDIDRLGQSFEEHIDDDATLEKLMDGIAEICDRYGIIVEINESSLSNPLYSREKKEIVMKRMKCLIRKARLHRLNVVVNSDSHVKYSVGKCDNAFALLSNMAYPKDQIVNFDCSMIDGYLLPYGGSY